MKEFMELIFVIYVIITMGSTVLTWCTKFSTMKTTKDCLQFITEDIKQADGIAFIIEIFFLPAHIFWALSGVLAIAVVDPVMNKIHKN